MVDVHGKGLLQYEDEKTGLSRFPLYLQKRAKQTPTGSQTSSYTTMKGKKIYIEKLKPKKKGQNRELHAHISKETDVTGG